MSGSLENGEQLVKTTPKLLTSFLERRNPYLFDQRLVPKCRETLLVALFVYGGTQACALGKYLWLQYEGTCKCK